MKIKSFFFAFSAMISLFVCLVQAQTRTDVYAVTNAKIVTVSGANIERGTVVVRGGLIEAVGANLKPPADARVIDGTNLTVYPGFFDALSNLGLTAAPAAPAPTRGQTPASSSAAPSNSNYLDGLRPEDTAFDQLRAGDAQFETARSAGFTTALTVGKTGIFNGQSAVINLGGETVSALVIKSPFAEHFSFTTLQTGQFPTALFGTFAQFRQMMLDAQRLRDLRKQYAKDSRGLPRPSSDKSLDALITLLDGQMPIVFNANSEREIERALDLQKEFGLKAIIAGGQEAGKITDRLKAQNVPVLLSLNFPKRTAAASPEADPEPLELLRLRAETPKTAAKLQAAGVKFAFQSGGLTSLADFFANAGKATENGLAKEAAIRAMTLSAAEILGVDNQLGSIEKGKIADLTVVRGDLFGKDRFVSQVFVDGRLFELKDAPKKPAATTTTGGAPTGTNAPSNVGGNYSITIQIPGQPLTGTLALTQQGETLSGTLQTQLGTTPIKDGKATAEGFSFAATVEFGGSQIDIFVKGAISGSTISGTIDSPQGPVPFTGTRNP